MVTGLGLLKPRDNRDGDYNEQNLHTNTPLH